MPKASDLTPEKRFFGLFIGPSGSGKTVAEASFPKPIEFLDFDGRIRGLLGAPWIDPSGITYEAYQPKQPDLVNIINKKLETYNTYFVMGQKEMLPQTLVIDSMTSQCFAWLTQASPLTHSLDGKGKGKYLGPIAMAGPEDYGFEATATYNILAFLRSIPIPNIIISAHVVPVYGKADPSNAYSETIITGEKLSIRDKISANIMIYFDHVFRFDRSFSAHTVQFRSDLARTAYSQLPDGRIDITGKNFHEVMMNFIKSSPKSEAK